MKKFLSVLTFALIATPTLAHAVSLEVFGRCGESVTGLYGDAEEVDLTSETVLSTTRSFVGKGLLTNETDTYVSSIFGLGEAEKPAGSQTRLYGWNYFLNGTEQKESPSVVELKYGEANSIQWFYGYILMNKEKTKCLSEDGQKVDEKCPFTRASKADCASADAQ